MLDQKTHELPTSTLNNCITSLDKTMLILAEADLSMSLTILVQVKRVPIT